MEGERRQFEIPTLTLIFTVAGIFLLASGGEAQQIPPGISDGSITFGTEPFRIDKDALLEGLRHPETLRNLMEGETGLNLPGPIEGIYFSGEDEMLDACRVICTGKDGKEPCYSTCGFGALQ